MMETEDLIHLTATRGSESENNLHESNNEPNEADPGPMNSKVKEYELKVENQGSGKGNIEIEGGQVVEGTDIEKDKVDCQSVLQESIEVTETVAVELSSRVHTENGFSTAQDEAPVSNLSIDGSPVLGVKRARTTFDEQNPSVHIIYNSLTRNSKRKLEELLQQWSEWHAKHASSKFVQDSNEVLESGDETYFPALHVGLSKSSAVSFWMDSQTTKQSNKNLISPDGDSVPLYDRGYALGLISEDAAGNPERCLEIVDAARCFNCGSYSHSLKECPKPRDNAAVNSARKQHISKRNQNAGPRNPVRYYENSPGGKYDGLRPGSLDAETRKLLGLKELDPPPWLNRMREIGYPPGYLDLEDEDVPSGITIFADGEAKGEDGEILGAECPEPKRKMSVGFQGINAPIPENADERLWAAGSSNFDVSRNQSHRRHNHSSESFSKGHYHEQRRFRDEGPPGCDQEFSPSMSSGNQSRHGSYDTSYTPYSSRDYFPLPGSPALGRSLSERGRRSPLIHEGSQSYGSLPFSSPNSQFSPQNYSSARHESRNDFSSDYLHHHRDRHDGHRHHGRR
ncbi:uncharacterized protein LOC131157228 [Malania oleifera]|uniref:uncharacterized protein LOC131157228 n=1 Tax=Malania oleifera TaxID=397392 RepID=UPI0025AE9462|nr:uncharacterized protein LOC131157228 [Malania oleifera]